MRGETALTLFLCGRFKRIQVGLQGGFGIRSPPAFHPQVHDQIRTKTIAIAGKLGCSVKSQCTVIRPAPRHGAMSSPQRRAPGQAQRLMSLAVSPIN